MILAVPILIAASLFLGWVLVALAVNALPLFSGISAGLLVLGWTGSAAEGLIAGALVGIAIATIGPVIFSRARSPMLRLIVVLAFAGPAAAAAYHAALGLLGHLIASGPPRDALALVAAFLVGFAAWRRFTDRADRLPAG
ncbi:hypothetical protein QH494_09725 [Sphingomonas sp. AR_OL41]|uniref:hypothetical protein n=1 Tax=Sphingomonas sp. AR_OL41 TaxID=3042729 RepID=UPI0024816B99|nr:hypothetical protein [Sphingomonas sp. AR_OL41]MDH7972461.1 hypothetical protein [Sphingomonas sp. AR_OL41]